MHRWSCRERRNRDLTREMPSESSDSRHSHMDLSQRARMGADKVSASSSRESAVNEVKRVLKKIANLPPYDDQTETNNFTQRYNSKLERYPQGRVDVATSPKGGQEVTYLNRIYPQRGIIEGLSNYRDKDKLIKVSYTYAMHYSDILYQQCKLALQNKEMGMSQFNLKKIVAFDIEEKDTLNTIKRILSKKEQQEYSNKDKGFYEILSTITGKGKLFFLGKYFPYLEVTRIEVDRGNKDDLINSITYHIENTGKMHKYSMI